MATLDLSFLLVPANGETYARGEQDDDIVGELLAENCERIPKALHDAGYPNPAFIPTIPLLLPLLLRPEGWLEPEDNIATYVDAMIELREFLDKTDLEVIWPGSCPPSYE